MYIALQAEQVFHRHLAGHSLLRAGDCLYPMYAEAKHHLYPCKTAVHCLPIYSMHAQVWSVEAERGALATTEALLTPNTTRSHHPNKRRDSSSSDIFCHVIVRVLKIDHFSLASFSRTNDTRHHLPLIA